MLTLVPIEVVTTTIPTITQLTATTIMPLTAIATMGLGSALILYSDYIFYGIYTVKILDIKGIYSFLKIGKKESISYVLVNNNVENM